MYKDVIICDAVFIHIWTQYVCKPVFVIKNII